MPPTSVLSMPIIDADIHPLTSEAMPLDPFIPQAFREAVAQGMAASRGLGYANPFGVIRRDATCKDPKQVAHDLLDRYGMVRGVLLPPGMSVSSTNNIDVASALARAWNDWLIENWLAADERYLGSISINVNDPQAAVAEIRRAGEHPRMVQVTCTAGGVRDLYGHRRYEPIYDVCQEMGLPFAIHAGQAGIYHSATPVGLPSSYFEWHTDIPLTYQSHLVSLVLEGVFVKFPRLRFVLVEGGVSWLASLLWRMDKNFKALRSTTPWLKRAPSEYVFEHVRLTTQPLEEPSNPDHLLQIFEMIHADKILCFSSDFPHWDFDDPHRVFPNKMSESIRRRIMHDNAAELYGLPTLMEAEVGVTADEHR